MAKILDLEEVAGWKAQVQVHLMYKWNTRVAIYMTLAANVDYGRAVYSYVYLFHYCRDTPATEMLTCNN